MKCREGAHCHTVLPGDISMTGLYPSIVLNETFSFKLRVSPRQTSAPGISSTNSTMRPRQIDSRCSEQWSNSSSSTTLSNMDTHVRAQYKIVDLV